MLKQFRVTVTITFFIVFLASCFLYPATVSAQTIPQQADWIDHGLIIDADFGVGWDSIFEGITPATLLKHNGTYYLYYVGADNYISQKDNIGPSHRSIGVATSTDGVNWTKYANNPIITYTSSGNPEEGAVSAGVYVDTDGTFYAYYGANTAPNPTSSEVVADTYLATSTNGLDFTPQGKVIDRSNSIYWGYGDELHANIAWKQDGTWYVYYKPNGTSQSGKQGVAWGSSPTNLTNSAPVLSNSATINTATGSIVPLSPTSIAYFLTRGINTEVRTASTADPLNVTSPLATYSLDGFGKVFYLDQDKNTWFAIGNNWHYMKLFTAPAGAPDTSPPTAPGNLALGLSSTLKATLTWGAATDPDTGIARYEILRNGTLIGKTSKTIFSDPEPLTELTNYQYQVRAVNLHGTTGPAASVSASTPADTTPPKVSSIRSDNPSQLTLIFTEPVTSESAQNLGNYSANYGLTITNAALGLDLTTVALTTNTQLNGLGYQLTVQNITDRAASSNLGADTVQFTAADPGGLAGYWAFDNSSSETSGSKLSFVTKGSPTNATGLVGSALRFNGSSDYLELEPSPALDQLFSNSFTVTGWVYPEGSPPNTTNSNLAYTLVSGPNIRLRYDYNNRFVAGTQADGQTMNFSSGSYPSNTWHHVAMVVDNGSRQVSLYVNGQPVAGSPFTLPGSLPPLPTSQVSTMDQYYSRIRIGAHDPLFNWENDLFKGSIDELRLYGRALSANEISGIYNFREPPSPPNICPTDLNGDSLTDLSDYSILAANFLTSNTTADINADGIVDLSDYSQIAVNFLQVCN